jgi:cell division transport system permease protein
MNFSSFKYLFKQGVQNFLHNKLMSVASVGVVASCLLLIGLSGSVAINVNSLVKYLGEQNEIVIYLKDDISSDGQKNIEEKIKENNIITKYTYVSKEEALKEQVGYLGEYGGLLESYQGENNPLPASFRVHIKDLTKLENVSSYFKNMDGIDYVSTPNELANALIVLKNTTYYSGLVILAILVLVSIVVISNTIRLTVYARRREISIMKYVGATNSFIELPFVVEGFVIGTVSAIVTFRIISGIYKYLFGYMTSQSSGLIGIFANAMVPYSNIFAYMLLGFLLFGWIIGIIGSVTSMRRYLKV